MRTLKHFINGQYVAGNTEDTFELVSPVDGETYALSPNAGATEVDLAYSAAAAAFNMWKKSTPAQRQKALLQLADEIEKNVERLVNAQSQETEIISSLMASGVQGIIIQPVHGETYSKHLIQAIYSGFPIVMLDRRMQGIDAPFVGVDNRELSRFAVEKLIEQGHQKIALLALPDERSSTISERMDGFKDACVDHHILVNKELWLVDLNAMFDQPPELLDQTEIYEKYVQRIEEHLRQHPEITAVFGTEYLVSKAAWEALRRMEKSVPGDVSLVSFDMDSSYVGSHTMSYIKQPQYDMGKQSVELLMQMIRHEQPEENICILDGEWIDGGTIAPVKKER